MDYESIVNALIGPPDNSPPKTMADALYAAAPAAYQSPQDFASANTGIGDQVRNQLRQYLGGFDAMRPKTASDLGEMALYSTPGLGNALSARDAYNAGSSGDWRGAALGAIGAVPFFGGMTHMADEAAAKGIRAYHGSPHDFDQFDLSKIGTGEGAQAYGHGLYFAENPNVAASYKTAGNPTSAIQYKGQGLSNIPYSEYDKLPYVTQHAIQWLKAYDDIPKAAHDAKWSDIPGLSDEITRLHQEGHIANAPGGRSYEVNINADPEHFLDWDKPLSEQSEHVQNALRSLPFQPHRFEKDALGREQMGADFAPQGKLSTQQFQRAGIPGIKYLDQGSRAAGEGSRNYVVFDDKLVSIVKKYGIPGAIGLGIISPEMGRQMQEQGI